MSHIYDELSSGAPPTRQIWAATIATSPTDESEKVSVVIPNLDGNKRWDDLCWMPRNATDFPQRGDKCWVGADDNNELVVVVWWPF